jgi:hypothetical protein
MDIFQPDQKVPPQMGKYRQKEFNIKNLRTGGTAFRLSAFSADKYRPESQTGRSGQGLGNF